MPTRCARSRRACSDADLTIADLECSMSDSTEKPDDPFTFLFTTNAAAVEGLVLAGIDGVSLANNHSMNFGEIWA